MIISIAQIKPSKGAIQQNLQKHIKVIQEAIKVNADVIIFPELSITGYEPELAKELACNVDSPIFKPLQDLANENNIVIGVGMPTIAPEGINISMLIFQPNQKRVVYTKKMLHDDELPYFVSGTKQPFLEIHGKKIALGICYETLQRGHFVAAKANEADIYIASVAKPDRGTDKAYIHFPSMAKEFKTPILMANCVGYCDNFLSNGQSAVWSEHGNLMGQLGEKYEGILMYNTETGTVAIAEWQIEKGKSTDLKAIFQIYQNGRIELERNDIVLRNK